MPMLSRCLFWVAASTNTAEFRGSPVHQPPERACSTDHPHTASSTVLPLSIYCPSFVAILIAFGSKLRGRPSEGTDVWIKLPFAFGARWLPGPAQLSIKVHGSIFGGRLFSDRLGYLTSLEHLVFHFLELRVVIYSVKVLVGGWGLTTLSVGTVWLTSVFL